LVDLRHEFRDGRLFSNRFQEGPASARVAAGIGIVGPRLATRHLACWHKAIAYNPERHAAANST
jgi:hypothetical protein